MAHIAVNACCTEGEWIPLCHASSEMSGFLSILPFYPVALSWSLILTATHQTQKWAKDRPRCWSNPPARALSRGGHRSPGALWHWRNAPKHPKLLMVRVPTWGCSSGLFWGIKSGVGGAEAVACSVPRLYLLKMSLFGGLLPFGRCNWNSISKIQCNTEYLCLTVRLQGWEECFPTDKNLGYYWQYPQCCLRKGDVRKH